MKTQFYFSFLTFCAISSEGIGILTEDYIEKSMNFHVRQKRIIDRTPDGNRSVPIEDVPYIVNIESNGFRKCAGSILLPKIIITAAHCFKNTHATFSVLSGSNNANHGQRHNITNKINHPDYTGLPPQFSHDIALLEIDPAIDLVNSTNRKIVLHSGHLLAGAQGTVSGWGCVHINGNIGRFPNTLRSIVVPIISLENCQEAYCNLSHIITDKEICTHDANGEKCTSYGDSGSPLVVDEDLIGVMCRSHKSGLYPDIFTNLAYPEHRDWITRKLSEHLSHAR